jgi:hypothetical protein
MFRRKWTVTLTEEIKLYLHLTVTSWDVINECIHLRSYSRLWQWISRVWSVNTDGFSIDDSIYCTLWYSASIFYSSLLHTHTHARTSRRTKAHRDTNTHTCPQSHLYFRCLVKAFNGGYFSSSAFPNCPQPQLPASNSNGSQRLNPSGYLTATRVSSLSRRPVSLGIKHPSGTYDKIFITVGQLRGCWCRAPSQKRGRICRLQLLLAFASAVILGSESLGIRYHILLSQIRDFPFRRLLGLAGLRWRYSTPPPHGILIATAN